MHPCWRNDVGAALFLEEEGEPERQLGAVGRTELWCFSLLLPSGWSVNWCSHNLGQVERRQTYTKKIDAVQALTWDDGYHFHLGEEGDLVLGQPWGQWERHCVFRGYVARS